MGSSSGIEWRRFPGKGKALMMGGYCLIFCSVALIALSGNPGLISLLAAMAGVSLIVRGGKSVVITSEPTPNPSQWKDLKRLKAIRGALTYPAAGAGLALAWAAFFPASQPMRMVLVAVATLVAVGAGALAFWADARRTKIFQALRAGVGQPPI